MHCRKMTLKLVDWTIFKSKDQESEDVKYLVEKIQKVCQPAETPAAPTAQVGISRRGARLNTKLKAQSTVKDIGGDNLMIENFWDRNFESAEEVPWSKFEEAFKKDYDSQLSGGFGCFAAG